jgi:hypothetical protein
MFPDNANVPPEFLWSTNNQADLLRTLSRQPAATTAAVNNKYKQGNGLAITILYVLKQAVLLLNGDDAQKAAAKVVFTTMKDLNNSNRRPRSPIYPGLSDTLTDIAKLLFPLLTTPVNNQVYAGPLITDRNLIYQAFVDNTKSITTGGRSVALSSAVITTRLRAVDSAFYDGSSNCDTWYLPPSLPN